MGNESIRKVGSKPKKHIPRPGGTSARNFKGEIGGMRARIESCQKLSDQGSVISGLLSGPDRHSHFSWLGSRPDWQAAATFLQLDMCHHRHVWPLLKDTYDLHKRYVPHEIRYMVMSIIIINMYLFTTTPPSFGRVLKREKIHNSNSSVKIIFLLLI